MTNRYTDTVKAGQKATSRVVLMLANAS